MNIETEIRKALDAKAHEVEVPESLASRTVQAARGLERQPLFARLRSWREARSARGPVTGYPRWLVVAGAGAVAVTLFGVGTFVTRPAGMLDQAKDEDSRTAAQSNDAVEVETGESLRDEGQAGKVAGVTSAGDTSVDATNKTEDFTLGNTSLDTQGVTTAKAAGEPLDPQLVRAANIRVAVRNFESAWEKANEIASEHGGSVIDSKTRQVNDTIARGTIRMRIPASKLDAALTDLRELGTLAQLTTTGDDISAKIDDTETRIKEAQTEEKELVELLDRAQTVSDEISVRARLDDIRARIASLKDKQTAQENEVEFATVEATVYEDEVASGDSGMLGNAFRIAGKVMLAVLGGTLVILAALIPLAALALLGWLLLRGWRRMRRSA